MSNAICDPPLILYCAFALPISVIDARSLRIPDALTFPCAAILCVTTLLVEPNSFAESLIAAVGCFLAFYSIRLITNGLGFGDVKMSVLTGLLCGIPGSLLAFLLSTSLGLLTFIPLFALGKIDRKAKIPFAPFLAIGAIGARVLAPFVALYV